MKTGIYLLCMMCALIPDLRAQWTYTQVTTGLTDIYESGQTEMAVGDVDGDGDLDIVSVGDHYSPLIPEEAGLMVFKNNGNGTSWTKVMTGDFGYGGVVLGDINNDGIMDAAYGVHHNYSSTDLGDQVLEVVLGDGTGTNWIPWDDNLGLQGQTWGMFGCSLADVDNDGWLDLGSNSFGCCDGVWIYRNNGDGSWTPITGALDLNSSSQFKFGDFDKDGAPDFIANNTQFNGNPGQVWRNEGNGQFSLFQTGLPLNDYYFKTAVTDVNNDGASDIGVAMNGLVRVFTYNIVLSSWVEISDGLPATSQSFTNLDFGDMNSDGLTDLIAYKNGQFSMYIGDGSGHWMYAASLNVPETTLYDVALSDLDHNGYADIVYWAKYQGMNRLRVCLNEMPNGNELSLSPIYPRGGEHFCQGSMQFIHWNSILPAAATGQVTIEFSSTGSAGPFSLVAANLPNSGTHQWMIPAVNSLDCYLRFTLSDGSNTFSVTNNNPFQIDSCGAVPQSSVSGPGLVCAGEPLTYSIPVVNGALSYTWTIPSGWSGNSTTNILNVTSGNTNGYISVVVTTSSGSSAPSLLYVSTVVTDTSVTQNGITLNANLIGAAYQWIDCATQTPVSGATNAAFTPVSNGTYAVILTKDGCTDTSSCHSIVLTGIPVHNSPEFVEISPNPGNGIFNVKLGIDLHDIEVYTAQGRQIIHNSNVTGDYILDLTPFPSGMYFLR